MTLELVRFRLSTQGTAERFARISSAFRSLWDFFYDVSMVFEPGLSKANNWSDGFSDIGPLFGFQRVSPMECER